MLDAQRFGVDEEPCLSVRHLSKRFGAGAEWSFSWHFPPGWKGACYDKELLEQPGPG